LQLKESEIFFKNLKPLNMLTEHAKPKSFTSLSPNMVSPLENRQMFKDWRLNIHFPPVNVSKRKEWFYIKMAIPGLKEEDFKIEVKDNILMISAEKKEELKESKENYIHQEYNYRSFKRSFSLPKNVDTKEIESKYKEGILIVRLPKIEIEKNLEK
jgi:HSP20 family protein